MAIFVASYRHLLTEIFTFPIFIREGIFVALSCPAFSALSFWHSVPARKICILKSYLKIIFAPKLFVRLTKFRAIETRRVTDLLRRMVTNFDAFLKIDMPTFKSTIFNVRHFVASIVVNVVNNDARLRYASFAFVNQATSPGDIVIESVLSSHHWGDIGWKISNLLPIFGT